MRILILAPALAGVLIIPYSLDAYGTLLVFTLMTNVAMAQSYNLLGGFGGQIHLGHGAFFGIGAYVSALAAVKGFSICPSSAVACFAAGAIAWGTGFFLCRARGASFALASLSLLLLLGLLARNLSGLTGGLSGLSLPLHKGTVLVTQLSILNALASLLVNFWFARSATGLGLRAIAQDEMTPRTLGVPVKKIKARAFLVGSLLAAFSGSLYPWQVFYVSPSSAFGLEVSLSPVVMAMLGGTGTVFGPALGALVMTVFQEWLFSSGAHFRLALMGAVLWLLGSKFRGGLIRKIWPATKQGSHLISSWRAGSWRSGGKG